MKRTMAQSKEDMEDRIAELESLLEESRSMVEHAPDFIVKMDQDGRILDLNRVVAGMEKKDLIGADSFAFVIPEHRDILRNALFQVFSEGVSVNYEVQGIGDKGDLSWYSSHLGPVRKKGEIVAATLVARNISELRSSKEHLRKSDERFRMMFELSGDAIFLIDPETNRYLDANQTALDSVGYQKEELLTLSPSDIQSSKKSPDQIGDEDLYQRRKDGTFFPIEETRTSIQLGEQSLAVSIVRDITGRKSILQDQLRQIQKMDAVGKLAGGIAHDFNQKLSAIIGFSELVLRKLPSTDPVFTYVEEIRNAGKKASSVIDQLLAFSRKQEVHPITLDLNSIVSNLDATFGRLIGADIERKAHLSEPLGKIRIDPGQLEQVILNLVVNARDAMPKGGVLTIETSNIELDDFYAQTHLGIVPGPHICLSVKDTGVGMAPETLKQVYEPFFTTKEKGKGTGLGLATVFGIIQQNGGHISVESAPSEGANFSVFFPEVEGVPEKAVTKSGLHPLPKGTETILLVEDEDEVRRMARESLSLAGYKVLEASRAEQALLVSDEYKDSIDLMVTDIVMPKISGHQLAQEMEAKRPEMKVLYVSGYVDKGDSSSDRLPPGTSFLRKPLTPENLTQKIRDVLQAS
ncbi:MAG: PAS domain S-box protein [Planctomycetota bacterium]|nr:PAS domain S-box protein [Planctomycetota bacterium]